MYELIIAVFILIAFAELFAKNSPNKPIVWFFCFALLVFQDGFRWETGTDWVPYHDFFIKCFENSYQGTFDLGFELFNKSIRVFTEEYSVFLIIYAVLFYFLLFKSIKKYSINPFVTLFLYYCFSLPLLGMNRQLLAVAICLLSIQYVLDRKLLKFIVIIAIAALFHKSALFFIIVYFFNRNFKISVYIVFFLVVILISFSGLINKLPLQLFVIAGSSSVDKMGTYSDQFMSGEGVSLLSASLGVLRRGIWLLILFLFSRYIKNKNEYYSIFLNMYFLATILYILFNNTILQIIVSRGLIYFNLAEIFIVPYALTIFKNNAGKIFIFTLMITYGIVNMKKGIDSYSTSGENSLFYPYKGVFINEDFNRKMY